MTSLMKDSAFFTYAIACIVLCCNLLFLWIYSGATRNRIKSTPNAEDTVLFRSALSPIEPPEIDRVLRAHANAQASIYPFIVIGLIYVLAGGATGPAALYFSVFCLARALHSYSYLAARQPLRTLCFVTGLGATAGLLIHTLWLLATAK